MTSGTHADDTKPSTPPVSVRSGGRPLRGSYSPQPPRGKKFPPSTAWRNSTTSLCSQGPASLSTARRYDGAGMMWWALMPHEPCSPGQPGRRPRAVPRPPSPWATCQIPIWAAVWRGDHLLQLACSPDGDGGPAVLPRCRAAAPVIWGRAGLRCGAARRTQLGRVPQATLTSSQTLDLATLEIAGGGRAHPRRSRCVTPAGCGNGQDPLELRC